jgi:hypothetical protein
MLLAKEGSCISEELLKPVDLDRPEIGISNKRRLFWNHMRAADRFWDRTGELVALLKFSLV